MKSDNQAAEKVDKVEMVQSDVMQLQGSNLITNCYNDACILMTKGNAIVKRHAPSSIRVHITSTYAGHCDFDDHILHPAWLSVTAASLYAHMVLHCAACMVEAAQLIAGQEYPAGRGQWCWFVTSPLVFQAWAWASWTLSWFEGHER